MLDKNTPVVLALGYFDSVHKGHQKVIKSAKKYAENNSAKTIVYTFQGNLKSVLGNGEEKVVYNGTAISMGNPHFVTFVKDVDSLNLEELGPQFEHHPLFPEGVNTEFVEVIDKNTVKFRVWERGSGETWACGTGASAVCVAAVQIGRAGKKGEPLTVIAKGGTLQVTFDKNDHVYLEGPAATSFEGVVEVPEEVTK